MKKILIFSMLLILFVASLFAMESPASEVVGFSKSECKTTAGTNLNFVSVPFENDLEMASDLAGTILNCDVVNKWNASTQGWDSAVDLGSMWFGDFNLAVGDVYMINVTNSTTYYAVGTVGIQPEYNLVTTDGTNLNTIAVKLNHSEYTMASELASSIPNCDVLNKWNAGTQGWDSAVDLGAMWFGDFPVEITDALMINVTGNGVYSPEEIVNILKGESNEKITR